MKRYERPMVFVNEELAEGIYAASGAGTSSDITYDVGVIRQWNNTKVYNVTVKSSSAEEVSLWTVSLKVVEGTAINAQVYNNWLASASLQGDTITITPGGGGSVSADKSVTFEMQVDYSSDSGKIQ